MNHSEKRSSRFTLPLLSRLQNLQQRVLVLLGAVYLVTILIIGVSVAYFVLLTEREAWLLLGGWMLLLSALAIWGTARILKLQIFRPLEKFQADLERLERNTETKKMLREQLALREASTAISSSLDLETALNYIAKQMGQVVDVTSAYICSFEPDTKTSTILAEYFGPAACLLERESDLGIRYNLEQAFPDSLEFLPTGQPKITHIDDPELSEPERKHMLQFGAKTTLTIPMKVGGQTIGYAELWESRRERQFTVEEIALCQDIARQAAIAIENARLFEQTQAALEETAVLYRVAQTLTQMDNEQEMFELVLTEYLQYLDLQQGGVLVFDEDRAYGSLKAHMVDGKLVEPGLRIPVIGNPSYDQLVENKEPVIIKDAASDKLLGSARELTLELGIKSLLLVPIMARGEVIGSLGADSTRTTHQFTNREIALVEAMANQLGFAIENIRLFGEAQRRAEQLAVLHEIDRVVISSLRLDDIYYAFARHAKRLLPYDCLSITLLDGNVMRVSYAVNNNQEEPVVSVGTTLPLQTLTIDRVISQGQPRLHHSRTANTRSSKAELLMPKDIQASIIIPLRNKGNVIGTWNIGSQQVGAYSPDDLGIAQAVADLLATAIENARLYQQAQQEISEKKRAEAALEEERALLAERIVKRTADLQMANEELARASRLKDEFLASMSHELRTPLTAVLGLCDVLKSEVYGPLSEKQLKSVNNIKESGRHLLELINDILDLSKIEAGKLELRTAPISVERICQTSMQFIKQTAHTKKIDASLTIDGSVSMFRADERRIKQILVNLLSNAVKFTPEGGSIGLEVAGDRANKRIRFTVWDSGIGISQENMEYLFQPFIQLDSSLARQHSGTGLGLVLVHRMVEMHNGETSVESEVGRGSRFTVSLPWTDQVQELEPVTEDTEQSVAVEFNQSGTFKTTHRTQSPLILVAEDDIGLALILKDYLQAKSYRVTDARNGVEALARTREEKPDIILMDARMPQMDGLEATRRLRADGELAATPIIVLTALAMPGDRERSLKAGATDYISKPIDFDRLVKMIETQLKKAPN